MSDPVSAARAIAPKIAARTDEIEAARRLPADLAAELARAGLFRMVVPEALGGGEASPANIYSAIEIVAESDASVGWCLMIAATSALNSAYLPDDVAREVFGDPLGVYAGVFAPMGRAVEDGDSYVVTGRWAWGSGSQNAQWIAGGALLMDGATPRMGDHGAPLQRMMLFRASDVTFHDTWHVMGLRGTGSLDFSVEGVRVPKRRSVSLVDDAPLHKGPLYAFPAFGLLGAGIAAVALGNAAGALAQFRELAMSKKPQASRRTLAERAHTQLEFAKAFASHASARAFFFQAVNEAWTHACAGGAIPMEARVALRLASTHATRTCADICRDLHDLGGGATVYASNPLQRRFRDAHVATQHMMVAPATLEVMGRSLLGLPTDDAML